MSVTTRNMLTSVLKSTSPDYWVNDREAVYSFNEDGDGTTWHVTWSMTGEDDPQITDIKEITVKL